MFNEEATRLGLSVNWSKTKRMHVEDGLDPPPIIIGSDPVKFATSFVYLGSEVSNTGDHITEINRRHWLDASLTHPVSKFYVPYPFRTLSFKGLYNLLCFVGLSNLFSHNIPLGAYYVIHIYKLVK